MLTTRLRQGAVASDSLAEFARPCAQGLRRTGRAINWGARSARCYAWQGQKKPGADTCRLKGTSPVELRGLEPLTPSMPWRCATNCATAPSRISLARQRSAAPGHITGGSTLGGDGLHRAGQSTDVCEPSVERNQRRAKSTGEGDVERDVEGQVLP
jgi:hypothetical protein